jgi:hypothetical protein
MERGPMALFGAIVAIGLGPAMWLGAQFGQVTLTPERPPAVVVNEEVKAPKGGAGAGDAPDDQPQVIRTEPKADNQPLGSTRNARPARVKPSPSPSESDEPSTPPTEAATKPPAGEPTEEESDPPESSTPPDANPPTEDDPDDPPAPPTDAETEPVTERSAES